MGISKTSGHIQIKIMMPNLSQEHPVSSESQNEDLKDMDVLWTYKIKTVSQNLEHWCTKDQWPHPNQDRDAKPQSGNSSILQIPKSRLKGPRCSLHLQILDKEQKFGKWVNQRPNQDLEAKPQSGNSSILQSFKSGLKWYGSSLHNQNQDRELKFWTWVYEKDNDHF